MLQVFCSSTAKKKESVTFPFPPIFCFSLWQISLIMILAWHVKSFPPHTSFPSAPPTPTLQPCAIPPREQSHTHKSSNSTPLFFFLFLLSSTIMRQWKEKKKAWRWCSPQTRSHSRWESRRKIIFSPLAKPRATSSNSRDPSSPLSLYTSRFLAGFCPSALNLLRLQYLQRTE